MLDKCDVELDQQSVTTRKNPALVAGFSYVANDRSWPFAAVQIGQTSCHLMSAVSESRRWTR
jgi:hypothetical protein